MDSVLEAFKHNPTDGSFSPLAAQLSENTKYLNQRLEKTFIGLKSCGNLRKTPMVFIH